MHNNTSITVAKVSVISFIKMRTKFLVSKCEDAQIGG